MSALVNFTFWAADAMFVNFSERSMLQVWWGIVSTYPGIDFFILLQLFPREVARPQLHLAQPSRMKDCRVCPVP